jgi:hypothetical protein
MPIDNLHKVWCSGQPLCVLCRRCLHRAALDHDRIGARSGNMTELREVRFVCSRCGGRDVETRIVHRDADIKRFFDEYRR